MKRLGCVAFGWMTLAFALGGFASDRATTIALLNGRAVQDLLVEKLQNEADGAAAMRYFEAVSWSSGERVYMRGYVANVTDRLFVNAQKVFVTIGRAAGQAVNVKFHMRADQTDAVKALRPGQDIAVCGTISALPDFQSELVLDDATIVPAETFERMLAEAQAEEENVMGDCLVRPVPLADLPVDERAELAAMARCAATAYPGTEPPFGYRAMTREEWKRSTDKLGYADAVYSEDGFFILGNGLRGRFLVHRLLNRVVIAWSGCDLLDGGFQRSGLPDVMACFKHVLFGETTVQFKQAADVSSGVLNAFDSAEVWLVGHSLGGTLVTYAALLVEDPAGRLKGATFNGLGVSAAAVKDIPVSVRDAAARRLRNVYGTEDPICDGQQLLAWTKLVPRRFGRSYYVQTPAFVPAEGTENADEALSAQLTRTHGIDLLAERIESEVPAAGHLSVPVWIALCVGLLLVGAGATVLFWRRRR